MKKIAVNNLFLIKKSLLVALCAVCGIVSAWGADVASVTISGNTTNYTGFDAAWTAANSATAAATLTLLQDISGVDMLTYSNTQNCTLDLNGHVLTSNATQAALYITSNVTFTVTDGSENKEGKIGIVATHDKNAYGVLVSNGHFVLNAGTIEAHLKANTSKGVRVSGGASFTMNGGKIEVETTNSKDGDGVFTSAGNATVTIHGGEIHVHAAATGYAVNVAGTTTITGGKFYATGSSAACVHTNGSGASLTLQGGYYNINTNLDAYCATNYHVFPNSDATYPHKVAEGYTLTWTTDGDPLTGDYTSGLTEVGTTIVAPNTPTKTGYTFAGWSSPVAETMPSANTEYTAQWAVASVTIGNETTLYTNFAAAWAAANSATAASTLTLLQDVTVTTKLTYNNINNKDCILDLNGHTLTSNTSEQSPLHINNTSVTFTITDGTEEKAGKLSLNTSSSSTIFGVFAANGTLLLNAGTIEVRSGSATACGVTVDKGTFTMNGGTIHVKTTNGKDGRGVYSAGTATIRGGTVHVEAAGTAYGVRRDGGIMTINDGKFTISGSTASYMNYKVEADANLVIKGGYYTIDTRLGTYVSNPYHIFDLTSGAEFDEGYRYKVAEGYTVTFKNDDVTLQSGLWEKAATPLYSGETPAKAADAQYTYTFNGWSPALSAVTADVTYTAQFSSTVNKYTITFKNGEEVLQSSEVEYGTMPVYSGSTPTKAADAEYAYTFDGWSPAVSAVTADATYTATYTITPVVASVTVNPTTTYYTSFADAWTAANGATAASTLTLLQDISGLSSTRTYSASHDLMLDLNGHTLSGAGTITSLFQISCTGSTFTMTDGSANHDGKLSFTAESTSNSYCVIVNNGTFVLEAGMMEATSSNASIGAVQVVGGTFTMNENGAVHVNYTGPSGKNSRMVHAKEPGGTTTINGGTIHLESTSDAIGVVYSGGNVTFNGGLFNISASGTAAVTNQNGAKDYLNIRGGYYSTNTTTYFEPHVKAPYYVLSNSDATYKYKVVERYTVTFQNYNGTSLQSGLWEKGVTPAYSGSTPTRPADAQYTYEFADWSPELGTVSGDATYTATYTATLVQAKASVAVGDGEPVGYATFDAAWSAATGAGAAATVKLLDDVSNVAMLEYTDNHNLTLDLNGHTLAGTSTETGLFKVNSAGYTFTVTDGSANKGGVVSFSTTSSSTSYCVNVTNGNFVLDAGKLYATSNNGNIGCVEVTTGGAFTMKENGALHANYTGSGNGKNSRAVHANGANGTTTINGGTIRVESNVVAMGIAYTSGTVTVNGGWFNVTANSNKAITNNTNTTSTIYIQGGYYNMNDNYLTTHVKTPYSVVPNSDATYLYKVAIGYKLTWNVDGEQTVSYLESGATITPPADPVKEGREFLGWNDGTGIVTPAATMPEHDLTYTAIWNAIPIAEVTIGGEKTTYTDFAEAWEAANTATKPVTITLLADEVLLSGLTYNNFMIRDCTLDLNGHTLSGSGSAANFLLINCAWKFTITDGSADKAGKISYRATGTGNSYCVKVLTGTLILDAGMIEAVSSADVIGCVNVPGGTFTMKNGALHAKYDGVVSGKDCRALCADGGTNGTITIHGGTIHSESSRDAIGIAYNGGYNSGNVMVDGGKFKIEAGDAAGVTNKKDANDKLKIQGGCYNINKYFEPHVHTPYYITQSGDTEYPYKVERKHIIKFINYDYTLLQSIACDQDETPVYTEAEPVRPATAQYTYTFNGWSPAVSPATADATYMAVFLESPVVSEYDEMTIESDISYPSMDVRGKLTIAPAATLTVGDLVLEATSTTSGEIIGNVTVTQNAYFDLMGSFKARTWYAIASPWQVDVPAYDQAHCGVYTKKGAGNFVQQQLGRSFDLIYYSGARRATGENLAWNYVEDDEPATHIIYPGRAYMIYLTSDADVIRFQKKAGADLHTDEVEVVKHPSDVDPAYADWNGIANPATYKAYFDAGTTEKWGQVYNPETMGYTPFNMGAKRLSVSQPIFVQPKEAQTVVANRGDMDTDNMIGDGGSSFAPRRAQGERNPLARYEVVLAWSGVQAADRIIVRTDADKETDEYIIGQDLSKMGVSAVAPQMWVNRYNTRLCIHTAVPVNHKATYPLGISVPQAGEYTIYIAPVGNDESSTGNADSRLYLTYDGKAIWNLSYSAYTVCLEQGSNTHYGLRIVQSPQTATGIDETTAPDDTEVRKVFVEDKIYIMREGKVYGIDGKLIK